MNLTRWTRRDPITGNLDRLRDEMERTFDRFFTEPPGWIEPKVLRAGGWLPPLDVSQTDTEVTVRAEVPGVAAKDLDISVTGTTLTISGQKEEHEEKKGEDFCQCERRFGLFRRSIDLPETIDPDKVTAESDNGVVTVRIAKKPGVKAKHVEVRPATKKVAAGT